MTPTSDTNHGNSNSNTPSPSAVSTSTSKVSALQEENASLRLLLDRKSLEFRSTQATLSDQLQQITSSLQRFKAESSSTFENSSHPESLSKNLPFTIKAESVQPRRKFESRNESKSKVKLKLTQDLAAFAQDLKDTIALHVKEVDHLQAKSQEETSRVAYLQDELRSKDAFIHTLQTNANAHAKTVKELQTVKLHFRTLLQKNTLLDQNLQDISQQLRAEQQRHEAELKLVGDAQDLDSRREKERLQRALERGVAQEKTASEQLRRHVQDLQDALLSAGRTHAAQVKSLQASNHALREQVAAAETDRLAQVSSRLFFEKQAKLHSSQLDKAKATSLRLKQQLGSLTEECSAVQAHLVEEKAGHQHCKDRLLLAKRNTFEVSKLGLLKAGIEACKKDLGGLKQLVNAQVLDMSTFVKRAANVSGEWRPLTDAMAENRRVCEELRLTKGIHAEGMRQQAVERGRLEKEIVALKNVAFESQAAASTLQAEAIRISNELHESSSRTSRQGEESTRWKSQVSILESEKSALVEALKSSGRREEQARVALGELKQVNESLREQFESLGKRSAQQEEKRMEQLVLDKMDELKATHVSEQRRLQQQVDHLTASLDRVAMDRDQQRRALVSMKQQRLKEMEESLKEQKAEEVRVRNEREALAEALRRREEEYAAEKLVFRREIEALRANEKTQAELGDIEEALKVQEERYRAMESALCKQVKGVKEAERKSREDHAVEKERLRKELEAKQQSVDHSKEELLKKRKGMEEQAIVFEQERKAMNEQQQRLCTELERLRNELEEKQQSVDHWTQELQKERKERNEQGFMFEQERKAMNEQEQRLRGELESFRNEVEERERRVDHRTQELQKERKERHEQGFLFEQERKAMNEQEQRLCTELERLRNEVEEKQQRVDHMKRELLKKRKGMEEQALVFEQERKAMTKQQEQLDANREQLRKELEEKHQTMDHMTQELLKERKQREEQALMFEQERKSMTEQEQRHEHLRTELAKLKSSEATRLTGISAELNEAHSHVHTLTTTLTQLQEDYSYLKKENVAMQEKTEELTRIHMTEQTRMRGELEASLAKTSKVEAALKDVEATTGCEITRLRGEIEALTSEIASITSAKEQQVLALERKIVDLTTDIQEAAKACSVVEQEQRLVLQEKERIHLADVTERQQLSNELSTLKSSLDRVITEREQLKAESNTVEKKLLDERRRAAELEHLITHHHQANAAQLRQLSERLEATETALTQGKQAYEELERELEESKKDLQMKLAEVDKIQARNRELSAALSTSESTALTLKKELNGVTNKRSEEVYELQRRLEDTSNVCEQLRNGSQLLEAKVVALEAARLEMEREVTSLQTQHCLREEELTAILATEKEQSKELEAENLVLTATLKHIQDDYVQLKKELAAQHASRCELQAELDRSTQNLERLDGERLSAVEHVSSVQAQLKEREVEIKVHQNHACAMEAMQKQHLHDRALYKALLTCSRSRTRREVLRQALVKLRSGRHLYTIRRLGFTVLRLYAKLRIAQSEVASLSSALEERGESIGRLKRRVDRAEMALDESYEQARRGKAGFETELKELREGVACLDQKLHCAEEQVLERNILLAKAEDVSLEAQGRLTALENEYRRLQQVNHELKDGLKVGRVKALVEEALQRMDLTAYIERCASSLTAAETRITSLEATVPQLKRLAKKSAHRLRTKQQMREAIEAMSGMYSVHLKQLTPKLAEMEQKLHHAETRVIVTAHSVRKALEYNKKLDVGSVVTEAKRALGQGSTRLLRELDRMAVAAVPQMELQLGVLVECERKLDILRAAQGDHMNTMSMALKEDLKRMERLSLEERSVKMTEELNTLKGKLELVMEEKSRAEALFSLEKRKLEQEVSAWKDEAADLRTRNHLDGSPAADTYIQQAAEVSVHGVNSLPLTRQLQNYQSPHTLDVMHRKKLKAARTEPRATTFDVSLRQQKEETAKMFTIKALATAARKEKAAEEELRNSIVVWQDLINAAKLDSPERDRSQTGRAMPSPESPLGANHYLLSNDGNLRKKRVALTEGVSEEDYRIGSSARALYFFLALDKILGQRDTKRLNKAFSLMRGAVAE